MLGWMKHLYQVNKKNTHLSSERDRERESMVDVSPRNSNYYYDYY